jgi:hypothetical protein
MALSGHDSGSRRRPLSGIKRTFETAATMSANDPKRTFASDDCLQYPMCAKRSSHRLFDRAYWLPVTLQQHRARFVDNPGIADEFGGYGIR